MADSVSGQFIELAEQAVAAWDGSDTTDLFLLISEHFGLSLYEMRNLIQAEMDRDAAAYQAEMAAMEEKSGQD